ncbi:dihydrolipoamide dehydrogenase [Aquabacterium sp. NJ1]|uniref:dihydrolipoyl dehydrogenase n=1 Tax=Aquabacterium sp. NJ1 TaxID=1538295 RepID=UPI00052BB85B|nr:dihydrolipoyl dehydrogenase [Aquabacterium sp. NJ1]KGM39073.1 dihydrolipoamide dehydrogenase [Aquabacterium sp. NJ1]
MALINIPVPDIGDIADAAVIEILVKPGQAITAEQSLITLESDKASMEVPSPQAGVVGEIKVKIGDRVGQGQVILTLDVAGADAGASAAPAAPAPAAAPASSASSAPSSSSGAASAAASAANAAAPLAAAPVAAAVNAPADTDCDVLVLGGGPGGYSAAFRAADLGLKVILVERYAELGGVCLNVGCIPSKALLHVAAVMDEVKHFDALGVSFAAPTLDLDKLRAHKSGVTRKLTTGLAGMAKARKVEIVRGYGSLVDAHHLQVELTSGSSQDKTGERRSISFKRAIIAAGSQAVRLPFLPDDPRVVDSTGALTLPAIPKKMLVIGGGIIGLEMGTVYSSLGAQSGTRIDVVEMSDTLMPGADRDLVNVWQKFNAGRFDRIMLGTKTVAAQATPEGIRVSFESAKPGVDAPAPETYDLVLQAVGRSPNGRKIGADKAGLTVNERGFIPVDAQMRSNVPSLFAIGDIVGQPMLAHKAVHEGHVAAEVIAGELQGNHELASAAFDPLVIPSVAYTDPEIAWVGLTEEQAKAQGKAIKKGLFPWGASGRALANGRAEGFTKLLFDAETGRIVGGGIVGTHAGDLISEVALAIEMGADEVDIGKTIHPHPTLGESVGLAAEAAHGSCTDLMPVRKR